MNGSELEEKLSGDSAGPARLEPELGAILSAIERLESQSDAKCHSTASRFEDFLYGTPLSDAARQTKVDLQKRLVQRIWARASRDAAQAGEPKVDEERVRAHVDVLLLREVGADGDVRATFPGLPTVVIPKVRAEQYQSIAYSLRAILAAQQDQIMIGGEPLLELSPGAIDRIREAVDTVTLGALMLADRRAREASEFEIGVSGMSRAWEQLVPDSGDSIPNRRPNATAVSRSETRAKGLALFDALVEEKTAAYRVYNDLDEKRTQALFLTNIARFYARAPLPRKKRARVGVVTAFYAALDEFTVSLLLAADGNARRTNHRLIRADDASSAVQELIPHVIDEFEDVHLFSRLGDEGRVSLEAYDCDSFRDFGLHWPSMGRAFREVPEETMLPDPFAAEILAEAVSQYGILLLRLAGENTVNDPARARLKPVDFEPSAASIRDRAKRHHAAPVAPKSESRIVSAAGRFHRESEGSTTFFTNITVESGVDFIHRSARWLGEFRHKLLKTPPTFSGGGVAAEDVDGDGDVDLLFVGGFGNSLFLNDGTGHFEDATKQIGIDSKRADGSYGEARNPIIADFDNDGRQDILITYAADDHQLFRNVGGGRFEDVSARSGLGGGGGIAGPATVFDFDGDGLLDVYVGFFGNYLEGAIPKLERDNQDALPNRLFRNLGGMRFRDVTKGSGTANTGWAQAVSHTDLDRDGRQDIVVANDYGRNALLRNLGDGKFEDVASALGVTVAFHSMNVGISDLNHDGHPDIYISNIATLVKDNKYVFPDVNTPRDLDLRALSGMLIKESDVLYMSQVVENRLVAFVASENVERGATSTGWAWDAEFLDFDHDGDDDLYLVNGTNDYNAFSRIYKYPEDDGDVSLMALNHSRESNVFFLNEDGRLKNVSPQSGADFVGNSRSTAYLDFDGDGDLDIAVNGFHAPATMLRNNTETRGLNWLKLRLIGDPAKGSNRDAIGARILVTAESGLRVAREIQGGSGYLSMNPKQQHFGLARAELVNVRIVWPSGGEQSLQGLRANRAYTVREGQSHVGGLEDDRASIRVGSHQ